MHVVCAAVLSAQSILRRRRSFSPFIHSSYCMIVSLCLFDFFSFFCHLFPISCRSVLLLIRTHIPTAHAYSVLLSASMPVWPLCSRLLLFFFFFFFYAIYFSTAVLHTAHSRVTIKLYVCCRVSMCCMLECTTARCHIIASTSVCRQSASVRVI